MWIGKKPEAPAKPTVPAEPAMVAPSAPAPPVKETPMNPSDVMRPGAASERASARLGQSLHVKGEITGNEDLQVDGSVEGLVSLEERKLTVGASAKLTADVVAREIIVYGTVKGNLRARDRIEIKKDGSVIGDLTTARIMIEDGAYFKGSIEIDRGPEHEPEADRQAFARGVRKTE